MNLLLRGGEVGGFMGRRRRTGVRIYRILEGHPIPESKARATLIEYVKGLGWTDAEVVSLVLEPCLNGGHHWNGTVQPIGEYTRPDHVQRRIEWLEKRRYRR